MRSFQGRDILSLKDFSRDEFFRVFQVADDERVAVLFTGVIRQQPTEGNRDEELSRARHPVAQGL